MRCRVELEVEVDVGYEPAEPMTRHSPGGPEEIEVEAVRRGDTQITVSDEELKQILAVVRMEVEERRRAQDEFRAVAMAGELDYGG